MELKEDSLTSVGLSMFVKNLSDKDLQYGNPYSLEKYEDGYWKNANVVNQLYFTLPAFSLKNNDSVASFSINDRRYNIYANDIIDLRKTLFKKIKDKYGD